MHATTFGDTTTQGSTLYLYTVHTTNPNPNPNPNPYLKPLSQSTVSPSDFFIRLPEPTSENSRSIREASEKEARGPLMSVMCGRAGQGQLLSFQGINEKSSTLPPRVVVGPFIK